MSDVTTLLGTGGYARVYRLQWKGTPCAAKVIPKAHARTIERELSALRGLPPHAHLCGYLGCDDHYTTEFVLYIELCDHDLHSLVEKHGYLDEPTVVRYSLQMHAAIAHVHAHDIAHRDIKLENWLVRNGDLKLTDFGLSCARRPELCHECVGSLSYCAPEILRRSPYDPFAADVWSYGVCVFSMSAGFFPFEKASNEDWRFRCVYAQSGVSEKIFALYDRPLHFAAVVPIVDGTLRPTTSRLTLAGILELLQTIVHSAVPSSGSDEVVAEETVYKSVSAMVPPVLKRLCAGLVMATDEGQVP